MDQRRPSRFGILYESTIILGQSNQVETPTHIADSKNTLYLTGVNAILGPDITNARTR